MTRRLHAARCCCCYYALLRRYCDYQPTHLPPLRYKEFLSTFDGGDNDGMVSLKEFEDYYANVGAAVDDDRYFVAMVRNTWRLDAPEETRPAPVSRGNSFASAFSLEDDSEQGKKPPRHGMARRRSSMSEAAAAAAAPGRPTAPLAATAGGEARPAPLQRRNTLAEATGAAAERALQAAHAQHDDLHAWLREHRLEQLAPSLIELGADSPDDLLVLERADVDALGLRVIEKRKLDAAIQAMDSGGRSPYVGGNNNPARQSFWPAPADEGPGTGAGKKKAAPPPPAPEPTTAAAAPPPPPPPPPKRPVMLKRRSSSGMGGVSSLSLG